MYKTFLAILVSSLCLGADFKIYSYDIIKLDGGIVIDGILNESTWSIGQPITKLIQKDPHPRALSKENIEIRVATDNEFIYVGAYLYDNTPDSIASQIIKRDGWGYSDWFAIGLDSYNDKRTCFSFHVNPSGSIRDMIYFNDTESDDSWDAIWEAKSTIVSNGWCTEMKIPLSQIRYNPSNEEQVWGLNFYRRIARYGEESFWAPILMESKGFVSQFGTLQGFTLPKQKKRLELQPYVSATDKLNPGIESDPYWSKHSFSGDAGINFKIGIGSNFTLNGTINPDFGQVEADPADLNLSAFETFFEEKRPFFLEGTDIFQFGKTRTFKSSSPSIFYSRRIGRNPRGSIQNSDAKYENYPQQTNILSALKFSGKTPNGLSFGIMDAITAKEDAFYIDSSNTEKSQPIEPFSNSLVVRLKQDLRKGKMNFGGFFTHKNQTLSSDYLDSLFLSEAYVMGTDFEYALPEPSWILSGLVARSHLKGNNSVITNIQQSSAHYFQRPDDNIELDTNKTNLGGSSSEISMTKISGKNIKGSVTFNQISPGFNVNELGYMRSANMKKVNSYIEYQDFEPGKYWQLFSFSFGTWNDWDYNWGNGSSGFWSDFWIRLNNWYSVSLDYQRSNGGYSRTLTRGGPVASIPAYHNLGLRVRTDRRKSINGYFKIGYRNASDGEYDESLRAGINYRVNSQWKLEFDIFTNKEFDTDQFITSIKDEYATKTYGSRYVFSNISNDSKGLSFESNMIYSPKLSFQFFLRPELSHFNYNGLKEFLKPGNYDFYAYEEDQISHIDSLTIEIDPDRVGPANSFQISSDYIRGFNFFSSRANFILKWEYKPGSAIYLVWQQQKDFYEVVDSSSGLGKSMEQLMKSNSKNTFMIKFSYWISS